MVFQCKNLISLYILPDQRRGNLLVLNKTDFPIQLDFAIQTDFESIDHSRELQLLVCVRYC